MLCRRVLVLVAGLFWLPMVALVNAAPTVVVTQCTQAGVQAALDVGGTVTFDCGPNPVVIALTTPLVTNGGNLTLDGAGLITLDGQGVTKILSNPFSANPRLVTLQNLRFINGRAPISQDRSTESGGAISSGSPGTSLHILGCYFENNSTSNTTNEDNQGGAIFSHNSYETVIRDSIFVNNRAGSGGAFGGIATGLLIYNTQFIGNQALDTTTGGIVRGYGGAIHLDGVRNTFNPDSHKIFLVEDSVFSGNTAIRGGGAVSSVVSDNYGTKASFIRTTFVNNEVFGIPGNSNSGQGGALYHIEDDPAGGSAEDNLEIRDTTFTNNRVRFQGGGAWIEILGQGSIVNTTFSGNTTTAPLNQVGQGGAMAITLGRITIANTTFANNHAAYQAGALHAGGSGDPNRVVTLVNTLFVNNTLNEQDLPTETRWQGYHTNRPMTDGGQNMQWPQLKPTYNNDVNNNITTNPIYANPFLQPLAANGGPTLTMAIPSTSPARNIGLLSACPATDQRGMMRDGQCDLGAFEVVWTPTHTTYLPLTLR